MHLLRIMSLTGVAFIRRISGVLLTCPTLSSHPIMIKVSTVHHIISESTPSFSLDYSTTTNKVNRWVIFIKGIGLITVPNDNTTAYVAPGETGIVFASDTPDITTDGHRSQYLGVTESIIMQVPALDNKVPAHTVLHSGGCVTSEMSGLWELALGISLQSQI